jgi:hypothetical protein
MMPCDTSPALSVVSEDDDDALQAGRQAGRQARQALHGQQRRLQGKKEMCAMGGSVMFFLSSLVVRASVGGSCLWGVKRIVEKKM